MLVWTTTVLCTVGTGLAANAPARRPNIVVIIADDLGYADVGVQGGKDVPTPNLDSIAKNGTRFTSGYVSCTVCSPTRAGLLTGRYQQRFGHEFLPGATNGLPLTEITLADRLSQSGYRTGLVGKWHLGRLEQFNPVHRGFQEFFGFLDGLHSYTNLAVTGRDPIRRGLQPVEEKEYLTEAFTREALGFIDRHQREPFYLQLAYNAVHSPLDAAPRYYERFKHITDEKRRRFAAIHSAMDDGVGEVLRKLRETGLEEDTFIAFFSDNGGPTGDNTSRNDPLRGFKGQTWEGGIRVPFFVQWKGKIPAGRVDDRPVIQIDLHATALALAGIRLQPEWKLDSVNLLPYLTGKKTGPPHEALYWRYGDQLAIRQGEWKLVKASAGGPAGGGPGVRGALATNSPGATKTSVQGAHLYNLAHDPGEQTDLASQKPAKFKQLARAWEKWNAELIEPLWRGPGGRGGPGNGGGPAEISNASKTGPWKKGDILGREDAPRIADQPIRVSARFELAGDGVIVAQGAGQNGYALYVREGKLAFALRSGGELTVVQSKKLPARPFFQGEARLERDGRIRLFIDGQSAAEGKAPGLIAGQPGEGLSVGSDGNAAVGDYPAPNPFPGQVENVQVIVP